MARTTAEELLGGLVEQYGAELVGQHRWFDERDRWLELVHAILSQITAQPEPKVRAAVEEISHRGLLDQPVTVQRADVGVQLVAALQSHGLTAQEADTGLQALRAVVSTLERDYGGKCQIYLRYCFEQMADHMQAVFPIPSLNAGQVRHAVRFWLQNSLSAPLTLEHPEALEFCADHGVAWGDLIAAADRADIHFALLDDLVHSAVHSAPSTHSPM
ncbi:MAG: hypothetical protein ABJA67_03785 [Chthonomonadales bacterium]